ncbi:MAG: alpha/beta hydrolase [Ilumatobacter sp.]|uniref:alpha/beta fold hydrolase n=1 Tax=Ilumatobacter sp. TaxID=1967498 RepID=UPI002611B025|nr:alpha/beta hydrolase [Ilumatobacter sp.]MDJ0768042.1 alpha/beta hydrolase [Ilumatobacter sp.]
MAEVDSPAAAVLRLLASLPGRREDAVAVVNGLFGDTLEDRGSRFATPMTIRIGDVVLPLERIALADRLADAAVAVSGRICVFVHGLMSTESIWRFPGDRSTTYGTLLAADHDVTVLSLRYNTGRHVSTNGRELAQLLKDLVRAWPVPVREINLVGHSMGGLVIRSACHYGRTIWPAGRRLPLGRRWTSKVRRVVLIGVPNTGAGLEVFVNSASAAMWGLPVPAARLVGLGLDRRSAGIKDLRFGAIVDDDWLEHDPGSRDRPHPHRALRLRRAHQLVIAGSLTSDPEHPVARTLGDALVTTPSAVGASGDGQLFSGATSRMFPTVSHIALAHHPDVYAAITTWW